MSANLLRKQQIQRSFYDIAMLHGLSLIDEIGQKYFGKNVLPQYFNSCRTIIDGSATCYYAYMSLTC